MDNYNKLSLAETERLAIATEEMGEALQIIGKILRHGYESVDPTKLVEEQVTNRLLFTEELGHVYATILLLSRGDTVDVDLDAVYDAADTKLANIEQWLHHQDEEEQQSSL